MMIKESGVNMDNQLYNQIKAVHEQYIKEQNRLEDEIDRLRREIVCLDNEDEIEALNKHKEYCEHLKCDLFWSLCLGARQLLGLCGSH